jgi:hypothetical protein
MTSDPLEFLTKAFDPAAVNFTPGETSDVSWITTDVVDNEGDVVVAKGVDFTSVYLKNPVVMACHQLNKWPVGLCSWIKLAKGSSFTGLCAKTMYDEDPDALKLFGLVQRGMAKGKSISFRRPTDSLPGDWGPPTPDELKARPDWKGARQVIRRCVMFEYSVCPIPMNQEALLIAVSKGLELPSYMAKLMPEVSTTIVEPEPEVVTEIDAPFVVPELEPHRTLDDIEAMLYYELAKSFDPAKLADAAMNAALNRALGVI